MGDYGTLRGYQAGELAGDEGAWSSLDLRINFDLWRSLGMPVLKSLGLQPLLFGDWAYTQNQDGPISTGAADSSQPPNPAWGPGLQGWRADLGFGFGRRFDLPLFSGKPNLRFYLAHPVGDGSEGHGWRFLIAFER
jgi:hemolysin activation/secretion protein